MIDGMNKWWMFRTVDEFEEFPELLLELKLNDKPRVMMHPATYLNKILIGFDNGTMQLWNIHSVDLIYTFSSFKSTINAIVQVRRNF